MPPQQQYPPQNPQNPQQGPQRYDFFMNPQQPQKSTRLPGFSSGGSFGKQIAVIGGIAVIVIILLFVVTSLFKSKDNSVAGLIKIAQQQTELTRVATLGANGGAVSAATQNFAQTSAVALASSQQELTSFLAQNGQKVSTKELGLFQNKQTDAALTTATQASNFDQTFTPIMQNQLKTYEATLLQTYKAATNKSERQILSDDYNGAELLLESLNNKTY